jgi:hypothetical protein
MEPSARGSDVEGPQEHPGPQGLREFFAERHLSIATMDRPLRLALAGGLASLVGSVLLIALRGMGTANVVLGVTDGVRTSLSGPLFVATLILLSIGFGYLLTGAVLAHRVVALISVLVITAVVGWETGVLGIGGLNAVLPGWARLATRSLLGVIWLIAIAAVALRRGRDGDADRDRTLRVVVLCSYCAIFGGYFLIMRLASPTFNGLNAFPSSINLLMGGIALLAVPMLEIAATDFGEWGELTGQRLMSVAKVGPAPSAGGFRRLLIPAPACAALAVAGWLRGSGGVAHRFRIAGQGVVLVGLALLVLFLVGRLIHVSRYHWPHTLGFAGLLVVAVMFMSVVPPVAGWFSGALSVKPTPEISKQGDFTAAANVRSLAGVGSSTLLVPRGWQQVTTSGSLDILTDVDPQNGPMLLSVELSPSQVSAEMYASALSLTPTGPIQPDGPFLKLPVRNPGVGTGAIWVGHVPGPTGATYVLYGLVKSTSPQGGLSELEAIVRSVRSAGQPPAQPPTEAAVETSAAASQATGYRLQAAGAGIYIVLSLLAIGLVALTGARWTARVRGALLLFAVASLVFVLGPGGYTLAYVIVGPGTWWPILTVGGLLIALGVFGAVALVAASRSSQPWAERLPGGLTRLAGGLLALDLMDGLYTHALSASRVAVWGAVILLVAVAWDVAMSGESFTNHASRLVPRASRVFGFFGYTILLVATVVYYSAQHVAGSPGVAVADVHFEPDMWTKDGLWHLAFPLLLLLFLLGLFGARAADRPSDPDSASDQSTPALIPLEAQPAEAPPRPALHR